MLPKKGFLNSIQDGLFPGCSRMGGRQKGHPLPKICHIYPTTMKLGTVIPYPKKIQKYMNHVTHPLSSADIIIFSPEISKFCYMKKYRKRLKTLDGCLLFIVLAKFRIYVYFASVICFVRNFLTYK